MKNARVRNPVPPLSDLRRRTELAGMTVQEGSAQLGRALDAWALCRPGAVVLDSVRHVLLYDTRHPWVMEAIPADLLDAFIPLADASDAEILKFSQRYGVLNVEPVARGPSTGLREEALSDWRRLAKRMRVVLGAAASLHEGQHVRREDWALLDPPYLDVRTAFYEQAKDLSPLVRRRYFERLCVADVLNEELMLAGVRPSFSWSRTTSGLTFTNRGPLSLGELTLTGALALQLALACAKADSIATCSGCHTPYLRRWHSPTGRRNYCEKCGIRAAWRDSKRVRRAEKSAERSKNRKRGVK